MQTPNAAKSYTMQEMLDQNTQSIMHGIRIDKSEIEISSNE